MVSATPIGRRAIAASAPVVDAGYGWVRGFRNDDVFTFRGIRYGAPTGGNQRFLPPRRPVSWSGVHDATTYGYSAPQSNPDAPAGTRPPALNELFGSSNGFRADPDENEDCLFLNVWTKGLGTARNRPVMVWLHGGGFASGSASILLYDGTNLARRNDVVVVGINHRLNVFGYTHFGDLVGDEFAQSGNAGQLDIVLALEWVRENIARFGGDPHRVTVFGESGGGAKVSFLLASPPARGLFKRAIIESGPGIRMGERDAASVTADMLLSELGLKPHQIREAQQLPMARVLAACFAVQGKRPASGLGSGGGFAPVLDPEVLPAHPFAPVASPLGADVPVIVGWNRTESTLFSLGDPAAFTLDEAGLEMRLKNLFGDEAGNVHKAFRAAGGNPSDIYFRITSHQMMAANSILLAERKAAQKAAPVYLYRFDWHTGALDGRLRTPHGLEMPFVFDNIEEGGAVLTGGGARPQALAARMSATWAAFAETGVPDAPGSGLPHWPAYDAKARQTMIFNDESAVVSDPQSEERRVLAAT
ncbi:MAG: carboxylesterase/lipase family protein [Gammaproteobacteria bacterium]|nr:carboxylesterase/lipase family protein [Gammaproteobacteria bacterium]